MELRDTMDEMPITPEPDAQPSTCLRCHQELRPGGRFCPHCGLAAGATPPPIQPRGPTESQIIRLIEKDSRAIVNVIILYILWIATAIIGSIVFRVSSSASGMMFLEEILDSALTIFWLFAFHRAILPLYGRRALLCGGVKYLTALLIAIPVFLSIFYFVSLLNSTFALDNDNLTDFYRQAGYGFVVMTLSISLQPAVIEELAFRGIMQTTLGRYMGRIEAIVVTAAGFAILHLSPVSFIHLFLLGAYLGWLREWSGGLYLPMLAHALHNFLVILQEQHHILPG